MTFRRSAVLAIVVSTLAAAAGLLAFQLGHSRQDDGAGASAQFYRQTLRDATGTTVAMSTHVGRVVVVNFWATWCVPCVREIPAFSRANTAIGGRVAFVGLGIDSPENIAAFNDRFKPSYALFNAGAAGTELARAFGDDAGALPFTVMLGRDGKVIATHLGTVDEALLAKWLKPYLQE